MSIVEKSALTQVSTILFLHNLITCSFSVKLVLAALRYGQVLSQGNIEILTEMFLFLVAFVKKSF